MVQNASVAKPHYIVKHGPSLDVKIRSIPNDPIQADALLSLEVRTRQLIGVGLQEHSQGIDLEIWFDKQGLMDLYSEIQKLAYEQNWSLPAPNK